MNLSTRLDYLGPANLCLRLRRTARPALRPLRNSPERRPRSGRAVSLSSQASNSIPGTVRPKPKDPHGTASRLSIRLNAAFGALRHDGVDRTDLQFALAGHVCATRTLNAVHVQHPGKSERLHPTGNTPPSHHSSVRLNLSVPVTVCVFKA